ncbi:GNAT family N-acetyltransferase [Planococcus dechangensis]|uniref:GNAT family N-acetyltransferase n=1 Tax=Planococcus dechangensis TaxID=1176255 RepID=A0ABV9MAP9_9BACL
MGLQVDNISFERLRREHLPLLYEWITKEPPINRFWGYSYSGTYKEFVHEFVGSIKGSDPTEPYMIFYEEQPIGYIQTFRWSDYPGSEKFAELERAAGLDVLIGAPPFRGKGFGQQIIRRFLEDIVFSDGSVNCCVTDPDVRNIPAIRAYEKVGFKIVQRVEEVSDISRPVWFMKVARQQLEQKKN